MKMVGSVSSEVSDKRQFVVKQRQAKSTADIRTDPLPENGSVRLEFKLCFCGRETATTVNFRNQPKLLSEKPREEFSGCCQRFPSVTDGVF